MERERIKILVVDDEEGILDVTEGYFQRKGYEVYTAGNGVEALEIISRIKIGCVFTDINMPVMDGLELAERIRLIESTLPVVVMTGYPSLENSIQTLKNGVVDYLIKPVNLEQMELTLRRILRERELFVENLILKAEVERQERLRALNAELLEKVEEVNTLNQVMEDFEMAAKKSSFEIFNKVADLGVEVVKADKVFFHLYSDEDGSLVLMSQSENSDRQTGSAPADRDLPEGAKAYILDILRTDRNPCLVSDARPQEALGGAVRSFMAVPLKIKDMVFGVASAFSFQEHRWFSEKDIYYMNFITKKAASAIESMGIYDNILFNLFETLSSFVTALEKRDAYTQKHSSQVARLAVEIAREMGCSEEEMEVVSTAGSLHDIGKIGVRDDILLKPGRLTSEEYETIKEHPDIGADIVSKLGLWDREAEIIRHHHERYDGGGYPDGLKGEGIPKLSRILTVADCYDAMIADRSYRAKMGREKALGIIRENTGTQFDPEVVSAFVKVVGRQGS